jgi:hypothetical protein
LIVTYLAVVLVGGTGSGLVHKGALAALVGGAVGVPLHANLEMSRILNGTRGALKGLVEPDDLDGTVGHGGVDGDHAVGDSCETGDSSAVGGRGAIDSAEHGGDHGQNLGSEHGDLSQTCDVSDG